MSRQYFLGGITLEERYDFLSRATNFRDLQACEFIVSGSRSEDGKNA
jgi:hypothetical protein